MSAAINFIKMDSPVKGVLRGIILRSPCCTVPCALLEAEEDQDRRGLRDRLYRSVSNSPSVCPAWLLVEWGSARAGEMRSLFFPHVDAFPFASTRHCTLAEKSL